VIFLPITFRVEASGTHPKLSATSACGGKTRLKSGQRVSTLMAGTCAPPDRRGELAPLLAARAKLFLEIAADDSNWEE
jgi:hypothetical protein